MTTTKGPLTVTLYTDKHKAPFLVDADDCFDTIANAIREDAK